MEVRSYLIKLKYFAPVVLYFRGEIKVTKSSLYPAFSSRIESMWGTTLFIFFSFYFCANFTQNSLIHFSWVSVFANSQTAALPPANLSYLLNSLTLFLCSPISKLKTGRMSPFLSLLSQNEKITSNAVLNDTILVTPSALVDCS